MQLVIPSYEFYSLLSVTKNLILSCEFTENLRRKISPRGLHVKGLIVQLSTSVQIKKGLCSADIRRQEYIIFRSYSGRDIE